jgi:hypothetical protein
VDQDITVARVLMVAGMAAMLLPLPAVVWWLLVGVFALDAGWLCWHLVRGGPAAGGSFGGVVRTHRLHHLVCHLTMLYLIVLMTVRMPAGHVMTGMVMGDGAGPGPMLLLAVDLGIVIYFVAVGVWAALRLVPGLAGAGPVVGARTATVYQVAVSGAMLYMLFAALR